MSDPKRYWVYIMASNQRFHILYTGITGNLPRRVWEHKNKIIPGFTSQYNVTRLVYYEAFTSRMTRLTGRRKSRAGGEAKRFG
jgi:putative endonuclease